MIKMGRWSGADFGKSLFLDTLKERHRTACAWRVCWGDGRLRRPERSVPGVLREHPVRVACRPTVSAGEQRHRELRGLLRKRVLLVFRGAGLRDHGPRESTVEESTVEESTVWRRRARRSRSVRVDRRQRLPLRLWTVCGSRHMLIICRAKRNDMQRKRRVALACFGTGAIKRCGSLATWSLPPMRSSSTERTTVLSSSR